MPSQIQPLAGSTQITESSSPEQRFSHPELLRHKSAGVGDDGEGPNFGESQSQNAINQTRTMFTNLYSKFTGQGNDGPSSMEKKSKSKMSPFKKAGDKLLRKFSGGNSEDSDEIFGEADCVDPTQRYYQRQI